jgi:hypothetical protein
VSHHLPASDAHEIDKPNKQMKELQQMGRHRQAEKLTKLRELTEGVSLTPTQNQNSSVKVTTLTIRLGAENDEIRSISGFPEWSRGDSNP